MALCISCINSNVNIIPYFCLYIRRQLYKYLCRYINIFSSIWNNNAYTQYKKKHRIVIEFSQTLTKTVVWYYDENAITHSIIADIVLDEEGGPAKILCIYDNNPIINKDTGLRRQIGVMELFIVNDENKIKGTYFNNPVQKNTYGQMEIKFVSRKRQKIFKSTA